VLRELHISGLGVIDDVDLELHPGLNVLTGETGAGKTLVVVALSLALGARAAASLVRPGAKAARVQARLDAPAGAGGSGGSRSEARSAERSPPEEVWAEDGELVLARTVSADGRGSSRIGGQIATGSALAELGGSLVEVHGQHHAQRLLSPATQTAFLDRFAGDGHLAILAGYRLAHDRWRARSAELDELREATRDRERELDLLAYQVREIEAVSPRAGETEELRAEEARLSHVERLLELASSAEAELAADGATIDGLAGAASALEGAAGLDPEARDLADRARALGAEITELARESRDYRERLLADPERLQVVRERQQALRELQRKYGATDEDVLGFLAEASRRLSRLTGADDRLAALEVECADLAALSAAEAGRLSAGRRGTAPSLAAALGSELRELGMPLGSVEISLEPLPEPAPIGAERAEVLFAAGPGQAVVPLAAAASGGELSRAMLACRSVLADLDDVPTLVFDEIDAGIGGQAGLAVGRRLARLAEDRQVVVVTHLPQIACFADLHLRVRKEAGAASVEVLDAEERKRELSRMLAGLERSESALSHAEELLAEARRARERSRGRAPHKRARA
jgi:DNA repair protein RecN (Recombination protein N)